MKHLLLKTWLIVVCLLVGVGATWATDETITLANGVGTGSETSYSITWSGTSCDITQTKENSSSSVSSSYISAPRWYQSHKIAFKAKSGYTLTGATVKCTTNSYATALKNSTYSTGASATVSNDVVTIETSGDFDITMGAQSRISSITVSYTTNGGGGGTTNYTVTVADNIANGTVSANSTSAAAGATVTLTATPADGYEFGSWNVTNASTSAAITVTNNKFTMPASDVNVSATFNAIQGGGDPSGDEYTHDVLTNADLAATGTTYAAFSNVSKNTAVYAGQSSKNNGIQLRATSPSGIVSTTSGGKIKTVTVTWNSNTTSGRTIDVYGSNTAYTSAADLYNNTKQGTKLGSIVMGTSTSVTVTGDYAYVGIRSNSNALNIDDIDFAWEPAEKKYDVTFNLQGHGEAIESQSIAEGETVTEPNAPTATGYTFGGWYKEAECTNAWNFSTDVMGTSAVTLYAKWTANNYTITYNNVEGATHSNPASYTIETATINLADASKDGYIFLGWFDNESLTGEAVTSIAQGSTGHKTFWAKWIERVKPATPTFSSEAGAIEKGTEVTISCTTEHATIYYTTNGEDPTAESTPYTSAITLNTTQTIKAVAILGDMQSDVASAAYTIAQHTAQFSINGVITDANNCTVAKGEAITFPADPTAPEEHVFIGWKKGGEEVTTPQDEAIATVDKAAEIMGTENVTYYAVWAVQANSTFSADDITNTPAVTGESLSWADTNTGVKLHLSAGSRYISDTPNTFTVTAGIKNYFQITADKNITKVVTTISATDYKINNVSAGTLNTSSTTQTVTGMSTKDFKAYATSSKQIRATQIVVTTASDFCTTVKAVTGVAVKTAPTTVAYCEGENFDPTGLEVTLTYEDETTEVVAYTDATANKFTFAPALDAALTTSDDHVAITIKGQTANQTISVRSVSISAPVVAEGSYTVKVGDAEAVTADGNTINALKGQKVVLVSTPADGYKVASTPFVVKDEDDANVRVSTAGGQYSFTMPAKNVTITAQFTRVYTISAGSCEHGSITAIKDKDDAEITETSYRSKVVVEATADAHYHLTGMYYVKEGDETHNDITETEGVYSFTMPQSSITVYAEFEEDDNVTITWSINGNTDRTSKVYVDEAIEFPTDVADVEGKVFQGWVDESNKNYSNVTTAPTYVTEAVASETKTYYAVFAKVEQGVVTKLLDDDMNISGTNSVSSRDGWDSFNNVYGGAGSIRISTGSNAGQMVTNALADLTGTATITFKILNWSSTETGKVAISTNKGIVTTSSFSGNSNSTWKDCSTTLTGGDNTTKITFKGTSGNRAYIKDILITCQSINISDYCTKVKTTPTLSFAEATYNVLMGEKFVAPVLNNPCEVEVSYSSSETSVADFVDGVLTIKAPGRTTITASFDGTHDENYKSNSASYELVVTMPRTFDLTVTSAGYATICLPFNATVQEDVDVYTGTYHEGKVTLTEPETSHAVYADAGYVVKAAAGTYTFTETTDEVTAPSNNNLVGVTERTQLTADGSIFIFANQTQGVGFYKLGKDAYLAANKAYLKVPAGNGAREFVGFGDGTETGINAVEAMPMADGKYLKDGKIFIIKNGVKYNVNGQRMR